MSNLAAESENGASAAPVNPGAGFPGAGSGSEPGAGAGDAAPDAAAAAVAGAHPTLQLPEQGATLAVGPAPVPPVHVHQAHPVSSPQTPPSSVSTAANHADPNNKYPRGPALPQRTHGPSLLTKAFASARGLPTQPELPHKKPIAIHTAALSSATHPPNSGLGLEQAQIDDTTPAALDDNVSLPSEGDCLTPRGSPRPSTMASSATAVSTMATSATIAPAYNILDIRDVQSMLNGHREYLNRAKGRGTSLERTAKERRAHEKPARWDTFSHPFEDNRALVSPRFQTEEERIDIDDNQDQAKPWKPEQRVSVGPEKVWSIGTGQSSIWQDGQVERSITEVLTGVEPNARSRKASHSLRFFREGLPDDHHDRRDSRLARHPREELLEPMTDVERGRRVTNLPPAFDDDISNSNRLSRALSFPVQSPEMSRISESPEDYFIAKQLHDNNINRTARDTFRDNKFASSRTQGGGAEAVAHHAIPNNGRTRRQLDDAEVGESAEDGDDSGEEKISSAVFLPHQADKPVSSTGETSVATSGSRSHARGEEFHPWLVKADEPEADDPDAEKAGYTENPAPEGGKLAPVILDTKTTTVDNRNNSEEKELASRPFWPSRPSSQYYEEHVHDNQLVPKQPLEAIELIPYNHQVGGHTTLWRFSKRAVCKQLNNRENEFYETIEKYHRDLLAFLPRYIGVLNVTFKKQPRRKSTVKRDEGASAARKQVGQGDLEATLKPHGDGVQGSPQKSSGGLEPPNGHHRVISQSLQSTQVPVPTVTFVDNRHILPRYFLQPPQTGSSFPGRYRGTTVSVAETWSTQTAQSEPPSSHGNRSSRPSLEERHANSWGATTVNKKLRNEVFNDVFLKQPVAIQRHRKGHHRALPRRAIQALRPAGSDPSLLAGPSQDTDSHSSNASSHLVQSQSDLSPLAKVHSCEDEPNVQDVTGTSAPEADALGDASPAQKRKRRYSGTALRRKPRDVRESRGELKYFEEADEAGYGGDNEDAPAPSVSADAADEVNDSVQTRDSAGGKTLPNVSDSMALSTATSGAASPTSEFKKIPRPVNPKEAQTQRDSRVEYFLLLEDLTAGMKRPCIMDLKMGTRQYGVDANPKKQKSQQGKCAQTTSRELGVRVCGLQVWDVKSQSYVFKDKYYGRNIKAGQEFQGALTRFLYDGVDPSSILRHIPTVLQKLSKLEVIIQRLRGYRFYAASLLMFYDGDTSEVDYDTAVEDSTTDFATDTEDNPRGSRRSKRDIDFKIADFANSVTAGDLAKDKPCPPVHRDEPDRGFLRGLRNLKRYFLKIQRDTRAEMGLSPEPRAGDRFGTDVDNDDDDDDSVSE